MIQVNKAESGMSKSDDELIEGFLRDCELRKLSPETIVGYKSSLRISSQILKRQGLSIKKLDKDSPGKILGFLVEQDFVYNTLL